MFMKKKSKKNKSNKKKIWIILGIILVIIIAFLAWYKFYYLVEKERKANMLKVGFKLDSKTEVNSEAKYSDYIVTLKNGTLVNGDKEIDTKTIGSVSLEYIFKNKEGEEEKRNYVVDIVDTKAPVIEGEKEVSLIINNDIDLLAKAKVTDNSGEEIKATLVGEYDKGKEGKYNLKYEAVDSSGNKGEFDFILSVVSDPNNRTFTTSKGFSAKVVDGITYIDGVLIANKSYSLPASYAPGLLDSISNAFASMRNDAAALGYTLTIGSGYRSYYTQASLYNNYSARDGQAAADRYSARPGHSEHQTGLAIDVCEHTSPETCINNLFDNTDQAKWINANCYKYGLILRYPQGKEEITGYMYESWHLRYVGVELATKLYNGGNWITLEEYYGIDSKYS